MSARWLSTAMLVLATALIGCGEKTDAPSDDNNKTNGGNEVKKSNNFKPGDPALADTYDYISDDFIGAVVIHPARVLRSDDAKAVYALIEKYEKKGAVERMFAEMAKEGTFVDPRGVEQVVLLVDEDVIKNPPPLFGTRRERTKEARDRKFDEKFDKKFDGKDGKDFDDKKFDKDFPGERGKDSKGDFDKDSPREKDFPRKKEHPGDDRHGPPPAFPSIIVRMTKPIDQKAFLEAVSIKRPDFGDDKKFDEKLDPKDDKGGAKEPGPKGKGEEKSKEPYDPYKEFEKRRKRDEARFEIKYKVVARPEKRTADGITYYDLRGFTFAFADDKTVVGGPLERIKKMLKKPAAKTPLAKQLRALGAGHDLIVAAGGKQFADFVSGAAKGLPVDELPQQLRKLPALAGTAQSVAITFSVSSDPMIVVDILVKDADTASELAGIINKSGRKLAKEASGKVKKDVEREASADWLPVIDEILAGLSIASKGASLQVTIKRPPSLDIPKLLEAQAEASKKSMKAVMARQNLHEVMIQFHNFHEIFNHFPAAGARGDIDANRKPVYPGLSWRVHLLPLLGQRKLYDQFKLKEPWDSPHNKTLIPKMPDIFKTKGVTEAGKTSMHVFTGKGTAFEGQKGITFRDFRDGTSQTFLAVVAGPDKADVWTKPGGLAYDPGKDPLKMLGTIPKEGFLAIQVDGSVYTIKPSVRSDDLRLWIIRNDGKPSPDLPGMHPRDKFDGRKFDEKSDGKFDKKFDEKSDKKFDGRKGEVPTKTGKR